MRAQVVRATVPAAARGPYLRAWAEWSGTLFTMGIRSDLLEDEEEPGSFLELTWLVPGEEGALADDRMIRIDAALDAAAESRWGARRLHRRVE